MKTFENVSKNLKTYLNHNGEEKLSFVVSILYHLRTMVDKSVSVSENQSNRNNQLSLKYLGNSASYKQKQDDRIMVTNCRSEESKRCKNAQNCDIFDRLLLCLGRTHVSVSISPRSYLL